MKFPYILACIVFVGLNSNLNAEEDVDRAREATNPMEELLTKEAIVKEALARFDAAQKSFDDAAEALQKARRKLIEESSQVSNIEEELDDLVLYSSKFTEEIVPLTLNLSQDATAWNYSLQNDGVIGVVLTDSDDNTVQIEGVLERGPAHLAGIEAGDVILSINDVDLAELDYPIESVVELINSNEPGSIIRVTVHRNGEEMETNVATVDRFSLEKLRAVGEKWHSIDGIQIQQGPVNPVIWNAVSSNFPGADHKVFIMEIDEDMGQYFGVDYGVLVLRTLDVEDIESGDVLIKIDGKPVRSVAQALRHKYDAEDEVQILVKRKKREKKINLEKDAFSLHAILE